MSAPAARFVPSQEFETRSGGRGFEFKALGIEVRISDARRDDRGSIRGDVHIRAIDGGGHVGMPIPELRLRLDEPAGSDLEAFARRASRLLVGSPVPEVLGALEAAAFAVLVDLQWAEAEAKDATNGAGGPFVAWGPFFKADHADEDWLIEPLLPRGRAVAIYAPAKSAKTLLMQYIAARAATGQRTLGQHLEAPIDVLYIDMENTASDLRERLEAFGFDEGSDLSHLHYALTPALPPLDTKEGGDALLELVATCGAQLVILDAFSRVVAGEENAADTVRAYYRHTGQRLKAAGVTVVRLDNSGKDPSKGARGTSGKVDDVDVVFELTPRQGGVRLKATHRRQAWVPESVDLAILESPLRFEHAIASWPAGTLELAAALDKHAIPPDWGRVKASKALKEKGVAARNEVLSAAIRYRRDRLEMAPKPVPKPAGTGFQEASGTGGRNGAEQTRGQGGDRSGQVPQASGALSPPIRGDSPRPDANGEEIDAGWEVAL